MDERGGGDKIYEMLEGEEGDVGEGLRHRDGKTKLNVDAERKDRTEEDMKKEADWLAEEMKKDN